LSIFHACTSPQHWHRHAREPVDSLLLKLALTPALIAAASLAGRRWGPSVSGWIVGLPFTSGPIALFLALDHGTDFACDAALGTLAGTISQAAFCLAYAHLASRGAWMVCAVTGSIVFLGVTAALVPLQWALVVVYPVTLLVLV